MISRSVRSCTEYYGQPFSLYLIAATTRTEIEMQSEKYSHFVHINKQLEKQLKVRYEVRSSGKVR